MWGRPFWFPALGTLVSFNKFYPTAVSMATWTAQIKTKYWGNRIFCQPMSWQKGCGAGGLLTLLCLSWEAAALPSLCGEQMVDATGLPWIFVMALAVGNRGASTRIESSTKYPHQPQVWRLPALLCGLLPLWAGVWQPLLKSLHHNTALLPPQHVHKTRDGKRHVPVASAAQLPLLFLLALPNPNHPVCLCSFLPDAPSPVPFLEEAASL